MVAMAFGLQEDHSRLHLHMQSVPIYLVTGECDEQQLCLHGGETEHNFCIMTQWGKHETVIL